MQGENLDSACENQSLPGRCRVNNSEILNAVLCANFKKNWSFSEKREVVNSVYDTKRRTVLLT